MKSLFLYEQHLQASEKHKAPLMFTYFLQSYESPTAV